MNEISDGFSRSYLNLAGNTSVRIPKPKPRRRKKKEPGPRQKKPRDPDKMNEMADRIKAKLRIRELKREIKRLEKLQTAVDRKRAAASALWEAKVKEARAAPFYCYAPWATTSSKKPSEGQGRGRSRGDRHYPRYDQPES